MEKQLMSNERQPNQVPPEKRTEHTAAPQGGPRETRHPENQQPLEGKVKGDSRHLLGSPSNLTWRNPDTSKPIQGFQKNAGEKKKKS
jgi:hypothetical protein